MTDIHELEASLVASLASVLDVDDIDADTSLFLAGGTSMHAEIYSRLASDASGEWVTFTDIFQYPTPAALARAVHGRSAREAADGLRAEPRDAGHAWHPVSENQSARLERLRVSEESGVRLFRSDEEIIARGLELAGRLDVDAMRGAVEDVVRDNGVLRTAFAWRDGQFRQRIEPDVYGLEILEIRPEATDTEAGIWGPLRLDAGRTARFLLVPLSEERHRLWIAMDHIVSDGVSLDRVVSLVARAYTERVTGEARAVEASDDLEGFEFAYLEESLCTNAQGRKAEEHWLTQIGQGPVWRALEHPSIEPYSPDDAAGDVLLTRVADRDAGRRLLRKASSLGTTLHGLVVFALVRAASRVTGERDTTVYWYTANRNLPRVATTIGSLAGITMVRIAETPDGNSDSDIRAVTNKVASSMASAFYPIDRIARIHRPDDRVAPDDRPMLVLHVNPEPAAGGDSSMPSFSGLRATDADYPERPWRRGYTIDASTRFTPDAFVIGMSHRAGMLDADDASIFLEHFADELLALAPAGHDDQPGDLDRSGKETE